MTARDIRRRELGGPDPLDRQLAAPAPSPLSRLVWLLRTRSALGLAPSPTPAIVFLPMGALLGPRALGLLSTEALANLDVVVTVGLAVLGILVGVALGRDIRTTSRLFLAASLESVVTIGAVAGATVYFVTRTGLPIDAPLLVFALALGLCASASSATSADPDSEPAAAIGTRVADLDDVLPIALASCALLPAASGGRAWLIVLAPIAIGLAVGAIGWLLFDRADSGGERVVFVLGTIGLAGGSAAYLRVSPLEIGLVAGLCWTLAPGRADRIVEVDLGKVQHPLVVLLLLIAGALWTPSAVALWLLAPYLLFRLAGKVAGAWASAKLAEVGPADLAAYLMPPGVLAVAFALNFQQLLPGPAGDTLLSTVGVGTAAFELFALAVLPRWRRGDSGGEDSRSTPRTTPSGTASSGNQNGVARDQELRRPESGTASSDEQNRVVQRHVGGSAGAKPPGLSECGA